MLRAAGGCSGGGEDAQRCREDAVGKVLGAAKGTTKRLLELGGGR